MKFFYNENYLLKIAGYVCHEPKSWHAKVLVIFLSEKPNSY